jgi:hypothetical protein
VDNLNFFGKFGGFEAIVNRIQQKIGREEGEEGMITVAQATRLILWVIPVARHLRVTFLERWGVKLKNALFSLVLQLSEAELRETKKASILLVVDCVSAVLKRIMTKEQCGELLEKFQLAVSLKCLESPFLEKRLNGLVGLNLLITMATRRSEEKIMGPSTSSSPPVVRSKGRETTKWLEVDYLVHWIEHKHILEVILQKSVHEELIKRSLKLFKFLAQAQRLTTQHITLIWEATLGKPKTIVYQLYNLLCDLIYFLPHPLIEFLCDKKLRQIPLEQLDNETLLLIRQATVCALNECEEEGNKWYGLETLWSAIQGASDDVASEAIRHVGDILGRTNCFSFRFQLMEHCVSNLKGHKSVLRSLEVLRKILETFPRSQFSDGVAMSTIIEQLESNYQFLDLFFEDLSFFKEITTLPSNSPISSSTSFTWKIVSDLKARLTFLQFLLSEATLDLEQKHIDVLWNSIFLVTSSSEERDSVFVWLSTICFEGVGTSSDVWISSRNLTASFTEALSWTHRVRLSGQDRESGVR